MTDETAADPSWLATPCPAWCERQHREDDHPDDRAHQSRAHLILGVTASSLIGGPATPSTSELIIMAHRHVDDALTWIRIDSAESTSTRLALSLELSRDLASGVAELLASINHL